MTQRVVNYTYRTGNPVLPNGSIDVRDGIDNLQSMDVLMNAPEDTYNQRNGNVVRTVAGMNSDFNSMIVDMNSEFNGQILNMGYTRVGTFSTGATLTNSRQTLLWDIADGGDGQEYGWSGSFPKIVPPNSTPLTTGGIAVGAWMSRFDPELRSEVFVSSKFYLLQNLSLDLPTSITPALDGVSFTDTESELLLSKLYLVSSSAPVTLFVSSFAVSSGNIANIGKNSGITISGAPTVDSTITSVASVTGSVGNFSVTFNLASAAGMAVGDALRVDNVGPGATYVSPADGIRNANPNELAVGGYFMGEATTTTNGTTVTLSLGNQNLHLAVGDLVHIHGQTRVVTGLSSAPAKTFTVDLPWDKGITGLQWWYFTKPNTGTLSEGGTIVNGAGTAFLSEANVGDVLLCNGEMRKITAINSDTQLVVTHSMTIGAGTKYTIFTAGILHEGTFPITAISGNQVTVTNRSRYAKPPVNRVYSGYVSCIKTVLKQNGPGSGFVFGRGANLGEFKNIAVQGALIAGSIGLALNGTQSGYSQGTADVVMGFGAAVLEFGYGAFLTGGCTLEAWKGHFTNNAGTGVWCGDGAVTYLREAVLSHNGGLGLFCSGGYARVSEARLCGNAAQGVRLDVGAAAYGDGWFTWGNGSHGSMQVNFAGIQFADGYSMCNGGSGADLQQTAGGRLSRTLFGCNAVNGIAIANGKAEATQSWQTGNGVGAAGVIAQRSEIDLLNSAQTGNGYGIRATSGSKVYGVDSMQTRNSLYGIRSDDKDTLVNAVTGYCSGNTAGERQTVSAGRILSPEIPAGTEQQTAHYSIANLTIADDAVAKIYCGTQLVVLTFASTSAGISGQVRLRCGSSQSTMMTGTGITVTTGVLTGTTGADGAFTISAANDGYCYIENRLGASRGLAIDLMGNIV